MEISHIEFTSKQNQLYNKWDFGIRSYIEWFESYNSGEIVEVNHILSNNYL